LKYVHDISALNVSTRSIYVMDVTILVVFTFQPIGIFKILAFGL